MTPTLAITVILYTTITSLAIGITTHIIHQDDLKTLNNHIKELKETNKEIKESILKIEKKLTHSRKPHDLPALSHPPTRR